MGLNTTADKHFETFQIIPLRIPTNLNKITLMYSSAVYILIGAAPDGIMEYSCVHLTTFLTCLKKKFEFHVYNFRWG